MKNFRFIYILLLLFFLGCQTINQKTDEIIKKENDKLSEFVGKPISEMKIVLGEPNFINKTETKKIFYVYETKKYGISCKRIFEINSDNVVVGFTSKGCF
mgnify:CR=1 FL=1